MTPEENNSQTVAAEIRLPKNVVPSRYTLTMRPELAEAVFSGEEVVDIEVLEATDVIKLNAKELEIQEAYVVKADGTRLNGKIELNAGTELATITFAGILGVGAWKFHAKFTGILNDRLKGFYKSVWKDAEGGEHLIATTQFEATDARAAFPCWDEPEFKAVFAVTLEVDANLTAISNGRTLSQDHIDDGIRYVSVRSATDKPVGKRRFVFADTPKMSTYLVCFVVGEFVSSKPVNVNGKEVRIWCVPGKEHLTGFALKAAAFGTDWYEKYFNVPYFGGDKIDHIAIPDFAAGAMENTGCITYRETALLCDEKTASHGALKRVAEVILHELAHMWFGDLVTMKWWNGLWLNESFATFMENLCLSHWKPTWNVWEEFALGRAAAARLDALKSTHPIECPVHHPAEIDELFDLISYEKGCSVLYQIHEFIGADTFRAGIRTYLAQHAYGNTETHDLWDALEASCKTDGLAVPVRKIMDSWVFTPGHPMVEVKEGDAKGTIVLCQASFKFLPAEGGDATLWPVPVTLSVKRGDTVETKKFVFSAREEHVFVGEDFDTVVVNAGGSGFYRVTYSKALASRLTANLQDNLSVVERFNLVNDAWAAVRARTTHATDYLDVVKLFSTEEDPNIWSVILGSLRTIHRLVGASEKGEVEKLVRDLVSPAVARLGWDAKDGESVQTKELRGTLIGALGTTGNDKAIQDKADDVFDAWKKDNTAVEPNVVPAVVGILAHIGDEARYNEFFDLSKTAKTPQETLRFLGSLAAFRNVELLAKTMEKCLSEDMRSQDAPFIFASLLRNDDAAATAWKFMVENFERMLKAYPGSGVVRMCGAAESLDTPELADEVRKFFAGTKVPSGEMAVAQMLEQLSINEKLRGEQAPKLVAHFAALAPVAVAAGDAKDGEKK